VSDRTVRRWLAERSKIPEGIVAELDTLADRRVAEIRAVLKI